MICSYRLLYSQIYLKRRQEGSDGCQTDVRRSEGQDSKGSRIASKLHVFHEIPEWYVFPIPKLHETLVFLSLERSLGDLQPQYFGHIAYSSFWFDAWWAHLRAVKLTLGDKDQLKSDLRKKVCHDFELSMHEIMCVYIYTNIYIIYIIYWVSNDSNRSVVFSRNSSFPTTRTSWSCECFQVRVPWSVAEIAPPLSTTGRRPWSIVETCWNVRNDVFWIISLFFLHSFIFLHLSTVFCGQDLECCAEQRVRNSTASIYHLHFFISQVPPLRFPVLEMFYWKRIVFDEFHELESFESTQQMLGSRRHQTSDTML